MSVSAHTAGLWSQQRTGSALCSPAFSKPEAATAAMRRPQRGWSHPTPAGAPLRAAGDGKDRAHVGERDSWASTWRGLCDTDSCKSVGRRLAVCRRREDEPQDTPEHGRWKARGPLAQQQPPNNPTQRSGRHAQQRTRPVLNTPCAVRQRESSLEHTGSWALSDSQCDWPPQPAHRGTRGLPLPRMPTDPKENWSGLVTP